MYLSKMLDSHEMMSISGHKTESVFNDYIKISGIELATSIAKKWRKPNRKQRSNRYCWNSSGKCRLNSLPDFSNWQRPVLPDNRYNHRGLMKENIEDISADIELQYGQPNMERNIAYVLSLVEAHATEDGRLDDDIPVPSIEAAAKDHPAAD